MFVKTITLNAILNHLSHNKNSNITEYFYSIGQNNDREINACRDTLKKDGYINYYTIPPSKKMETLTEKGIAFVKAGGYKGEINKAILTEIEQNQLRQNALRFINQDQNNIKIKKGIISNDRIKLEYVVFEITEIIEKIEAKQIICRLPILSTT